VRSDEQRLPFDLLSLQVFLAVCDTKTMAAAAGMLGLTQPAVSQAILEMERKLGTQLFDRSIRPIALTPAGTILRQRASALVTDARQIIPLLQKSQRGYLPVLRVGLVDSVTRALSVAVLRVLAEAAEHIMVLSGLTAAHSSGLLTRQLDLLIGVDDMTEVGGLERRLIVDEPYVLITRPGVGKPSLESLTQQQPFIRYSARSSTGAQIERYLRSLGLEPARGVEFDRPYGVSAAVASGYGWAITTPLCLIDADVPPQSITIHPLPKLGLRRSLIVISRHKELGPAPRELCDAAIDELQERCAQQLKKANPWIVEAMNFGPRSPRPAATSARRGRPATL
jgi:DNA-binding transcriptional LysR family regulator